MYRTFFSQSPLLAMPLAALVIFLVVFAAVMVRTLRRRPESFDREAALPLQDGGAL